MQAVRNSRPMSSCAAGLALPARPPLLCGPVAHLRCRRAAIPSPGVPQHFARADSPPRHAAGLAGCRGPLWSGRRLSDRSQATVIVPHSVAGAVSPEPANPNDTGSLQSDDMDEEAQARRRARALVPYLVAMPKHGIIGTSSYADRLRKQVVAASRDRKKRPVLVFGEAGLEKSNVAALIHFGGPGRTKPMVSLDCSRVDWSGSDLFGRGDRAGLVENIGDGTLLLKNVHKLPPGLIPRVIRLLTDGVYRRAAPLKPGQTAAEAAAAAAASVSNSASSSGDTDGVTSSMDLPGPGSGGAITRRPLRRAACRILMTSSRQVPQLDTVPGVTMMKVPPLRLRPADVKDLQRFYLAEASRRAASAATDSDPAGNPRPLRPTAAAVRQLEAYSWPGNIGEVQSVVERAVLQSIDPEGGQLTEETFWVAKQAKDRLKVNLLAYWEPHRWLLRSRLWPDAINFNFTAYVYPAIVALLLWGPQDRLHNPALAVFWDYWWPVVFISFPFLGRVWCSVCPFMIYGELAQRVRTHPAVEKLFGKLHKWPREAAGHFGPWFLLALFAAILVWEEVWDLPHTAALSGALLLLITAGAVACSLVWERRLWCRYLCPIGGMNGMFAKLAATEVRARQGVCAGECHTYHCYKGGCAQPPDGMESPGCPLYSHPAQLVDNRNCVGCMECLRACPNGSVEVRLRVPGADLWSGHTAMSAEVALMTMLLGAVYLHHLPELTAQFGLDAAALGLTSITPQHIAVSFAVLAAPGAAAWAADATGRTRFGEAIGERVHSLLTSLYARITAGTPGASSPDAALPPPRPATPFLELSYGYLPLVWAATLAYYIEGLLGEGGRLLPISAAMFGWEHAPLPQLVADPAVIEFLQGGLLLAGAGLSAVLSRKLAAAPWCAFLPQLSGIAVFTIELWELIMP